MAEKYDSVAIDGPAGSGKSTIAKAAAERLGFLYVDTGAMYRSIALLASRKMINLEDEAAMTELAESVEIDFDESGTKIMVNGEDVSEAIRTPEVTAITKFAARASGVRECLVKKQSAMARERPVVMEGRDITTVVLKDARWKFFVTASPEERANRRLKDFQSKGHDVDYDTLLKEINARDESDNAVGPMKEAQDIAKSGGEIKLLDTTEMTPSEVIDAIEKVVREG